MDHDDARLLERWADAADERAFAALVERWTPLVLGACRRVCGAADAEDAAQAVFLVLAHKARALTGHPALGGWLHRTAVHIATRHRDAARARRAREQEAAAMPPPDAGDAAAVLRAAVDAALSDLPDPYRVPLVLRHLEGREVDDIARALGATPAAMAMRLSRARERLRRALARRGIAAAAAPAALALVVADASPAEAPAFAARAASGATAFRAGQPGGVAAQLARDALSSATIAAVASAGIAAAVAIALALLVVVLAVGKPAATVDAATPAAAEGAAADDAGEVDADAAVIAAARAAAAAARVAANDDAPRPVGERSQEWADGDRRADVVDPAHPHRLASGSWRIATWGDPDGAHAATGVAELPRVLATRLSVSATRAPLDELANELVDGRAVRIAVDDDIAATLVDAALERLPLRDVLDRLCRDHGLAWSEVADGLRIQRAPAPPHDVD